MRRALWYFAKVGVLIALFFWQQANPGTVAIEWGGYVYQAPLIVALIFAILVLGAGAVGYHIFRNLMKSGRWYRRLRGESQNARAVESLSQGLVAVAVGDVGAATQAAKKAARLQPGAPLSLLLQAQTAQLTGDDQAAAQFFEAMSARPETAVFGLRGLVQQALRAGDVPRAKTLAQQALALKPSAGWIYATLFDLERQRGDCEAAESVLRRAIDNRAMDEDLARRRIADLLLARAEVLVAGRQINDAAALERRAYQEAPRHIPALTTWIGRLVEQGKASEAERVAKSAWRRLQTPALMQSILAIYPEQPFVDRLKRLKRYADLGPGLEVDLALAETALSARDFAFGRRVLSKHGDGDGARDPRYLQLMADLERAEGNDNAAGDWDQRARQARDNSMMVRRLEATA
jgi:HemY protein